MNTEEKLNKLYELKTALAEMEKRKQAEIDTILTSEILAQVEEIRKKWADTTENMTAEIVELEANIKADVLAGKETVKGNKLMAVWNKGRVTWDGDKLDGIMALVPQLKVARIVADPTVTIRKMKGQWGTD